MSSLVLNEKSAKTTIADLLASATEPVINIEDEGGRLLATIHLNQDGAKGDEDLADLRRRRAADRARDVTTQQLLAKAASAAKE